MHENGMDQEHSLIQASVGFEGSKKNQRIFNMISYLENVSAKVRLKLCSNDNHKM